MRRFPFSPNPVGWFVVSYSDELSVRGVVPLHYFGVPLVLYRGADGRARVLDAHCPHLGAHLGHGGAVDGNAIRCPFHAWCFDGDGVCVEAPYARRLPRAQVRSWPVCERNGMVLVYFHPRGEPPAWDVPALPESTDAEWTPYERRRWRIRTDVREMVENAFDAGHFRYLHGLERLPEPQVEFDGPRFRLRARTLQPTPLGTIDGALDIRSHGFGFGTARFTGLIETLLITTVTPVDAEHVDARFTFTVRRLADAHATATVGACFIDELARQVDQDIRVWENKAYLERPVLCDGDALIPQFRRWAQQFYPT